MKAPLLSRIFGRKATLPSAPTDAAAQVFPALAPPLTIASAIHPAAQSSLAAWRNRPASSGGSSADGGFLEMAGWVSAGVSTLAVGLLLGRELRRRYKFNRRTPYDFYAHAGDERDLEFGVGI